MRVAPPIVLERNNPCEVGPLNLGAAGTTFVEPECGRRLGAATGNRERDCPAIAA